MNAARGFKPQRKSQIQTLLDSVFGGGHPIRTIYPHGIHYLMPSFKPGFILAFKFVEPSTGVGLCRGRRSTRQEATCRDKKLQFAAL